ncbi:MAG: zinc ribbon domain-containing protein [Desulfobacteraceae bacterium]|nr:zinc ribbon domain-containing protein [Desulfobacteraceae bacterium]MCB9494188.1 zinc ribbon domain-containing protein [Desulfobacteraceae bacterium]
MPIYEFRCLECKEIFEVIIVSGNEDDEIKCSKCGSSSFERVLSSGSISVSSSGGGPGQSPSVKERNCSTGSCTTYTIPGQS